MDQQIPSVGRIVHYVNSNNSENKDHLAAVITKVNLGSFTVGLCIINPTEISFEQEVPMSLETKEEGTWHWPERS